MSAHDTLQNHIAPIARDTQTQWAFNVEGRNCTFKGSGLQKTDLAVVGELLSVTIRADAAATGLHAQLELTPESAYFTLTASLPPQVVLETITRILAALPDDNVRTAPLATDTSEARSVDETRKLPSLELSISTLKDLEEQCRKIARNLDIDVAGYRSLISVSADASADTYNSVESLECRYESKSFPDRTREVKLCMWMFTSQEDADSYDVSRPTIELKFTKSEATLHIEGKIPKPSQFVRDIHHCVTAGVRPARNNHALAHRGLFLVLIMVLGVAVSVGGVVILGETSGVLTTFGLLAAVSYVAPFVVPRLFPYTLFTNHESERRRRTYINVCKFLLLGILLPVIVERVKNHL